MRDFNFHVLLAIASCGYQRRRFTRKSLATSRKGRVLSLDEINQVSAVADSLTFTIEQMVKIDEAYRAAFRDRG